MGTVWVGRGCNWFLRDFGCVKDAEYDVYGGLQRSRMTTTGTGLTKNGEESGQNATTLWSHTLRGENGNFAIVFPSKWT